ncbi:MAG: hypothetical protein GQ569_08755 [Methylococcaceae bacterium]|nr:hypothetical protein [Methylococcaceae bacterium]
MIKLIAKSMILSSLLLTACAQQTGWTPTVDTYGDQNAHRLNQDMQECQQLALRSSGDTVQDAAIGTGVGAVAGAATGAAVGATSGAIREDGSAGEDAGTGAIIGGALGAAVGGIQQGYTSDSQYQKAYADCLRYRGHRVID